MDKIFSIQLKEVSISQTQSPQNSWQQDTKNQGNSVRVRKKLKRDKDKLNKNYTFPNLLIKKDQQRDAIINVSFYYEVHEVVETQILKGEKKESIRVLILGFINMEIRLWLCKACDRRVPVEGISEGQRSLEKLGGL